MNPVQRLGAGLRQQHWGQVVLELALLVAGILIALAVDGWIDDRRDARTERQYLELLARDLGRDLDVLAEFTAFEEQQVANGIAAYRALRTGVTEQDRERVALALSELMSRRTLRLVRATYTDLLSTGNLRLIRNVALRDRIVNLYEANERLLVIRDRNNQVFVDQMFMQYLMDSGLIAPRPIRDLPLLAKAHQAFAEQLDVPVDASNDRLWRLSAEGPERSILLNKVWYRTVVSYAAIDQSQQMAIEIAEVRQAISDELAGHQSR